MTITRGYKAFDRNWRCRGFQFEVGRTYSTNKPVEICKSGFHFCDEIFECFLYYPPGSKIAEVEALGDVVGDEWVCGKYATNKIRIIREVPLKEVFNSVKKSGKNTGYCNIGNLNSGDFNSGHFNTGSYNVGFCNTGSYNRGKFNSGSFNIGDSNTGSYNKGRSNLGSYNIGDKNAGNYNIGNNNMGDFNTCDSELGFFNTYHISDGCNLHMFNKPIIENDYTKFVSQIRSSAGMFVITSIPKHIAWVDYTDMTEKERDLYPECVVAGGFLKAEPVKKHIESVNYWWSSLPDNERQVVRLLPNFDENVFLKVLRKVMY